MKRLVMTMIRSNPSSCNLINTLAKLPAAINTTAKGPKVQWFQQSTRQRCLSNSSYSTLNTNETSPYSESNDKNIPFYGLPQKPGRRRPLLLSSLLSPLSTIQSILQLSPSTSQNISNFIEQSMIAIRDPTRADAVAAVSEITGRYQLGQLLQRMQQHPIGQQILQDRPIVSKSTIPYESLIEQAQQVTQKYGSINHVPDDELTFGIAYGMFLLKHGFDPDGRDDVKYLQSSSNERDIAYVMLRYRQCHDYWHVLTKLPPTVNGEIGLKLLELFHMNMPVAALSCLAQTAVIVKNTSGIPLLYNTNQSDITTKANINDLHTIWNLYLPWARQQAHTMQTDKICLLNVYYEQEFGTPLHLLRTKLRVQPYVLPT